MLTFFVTIGQFVRAIWRGMKDAEFRAMFWLVTALLLTGTLFYSRVEGWSGLDSLYFCVITLATVGYGDLSPTKPISKIFTIIYILLGIGILVAFVGTVAQHAVLPSWGKKGGKGEVASAPSGAENGNDQLGKNRS